MSSILKDYNDAVLNYKYIVLEINMKFFSDFDIKNLFLRIISGFFICFLLIYSVTVGGYIFICCISFITMMILYEWVDIILSDRYITKNNVSLKKKDNKINNLNIDIILYRIEWILLGFIYSFSFLMSMLHVRSEDIFGYYYTILALYIVWSNDVMSYIIGNIVGGPKIFQKISPNKTYSGLFGGIFSSLILYSFYYYYVSDLVSPFWVLIFSCISHFGDIFESYFKRKFYVKDSSKFIPGHGGFLDRFDSLVMVSSAISIYIKFIN